MMERTSIIYWTVIHAQSWDDAYLYGGGIECHLSWLGFSQASYFLSYRDYEEQATGSVVIDYGHTASSAGPGVFKQEPGRICGYNKRPRCIDVYSGPCILKPLYLTIPCILRPCISDTTCIFSV